MEKTQIFCDCCAGEIAPTKGDWDAAPSDVTFVLGGPGSNEGKIYLPHVCRSCRQGMRAVLDAYLISRAPKP